MGVSVRFDACDYRRESCISSDQAGQNSARNTILLSIWVSSFIVLKERQGVRLLQTGQMKPGWAKKKSPQARFTY